MVGIRLLTKIKEKVFDAFLGVGWVIQHDWMEWLLWIIATLSSLLLLYRYLLIMG
jgi:hypothetical protein